MNIQEIDKWLDNEYGVSYTRLEELHDYFFEKYVDQKEEIERLKNQLQQKENKEKEIREYLDCIKEKQKVVGVYTKDIHKHILEILDKENK